MMKSSSLALILLAAGSSSRMEGSGKKEFLALGKGSVLSSSFRAFLDSAAGLEAPFLNAVICCAPGLEQKTRDILFSDPDIALHKNLPAVDFIPGGSTRQESVRLALDFLQDRLSPDAIVMIHDGARPYLSTDLVMRTVLAADLYGAAVPALVPVDTQKTVDSQNHILCHLKRSELRAVQTPQAFEYGVIRKCHEVAAADGGIFTDDSEIWDAYPALNSGRRVRVVQGEAGNIKITYPGDIPHKKEAPLIRVGLGSDMHVLEEGRRLVLGGVHIPFEKGELGHSDGDVLLHAVSDALLGASGLGDIGSYFPPEEPEWKDADSRMLLKKIWDDVRADGWSLVNLDAVLEIEKPKFLPYRMDVIKSLAGILDVEQSRVFVKAKTNEGLGPVGEGRAVKALCTCLLEKNVLP